MGGPGKARRSDPHTQQLNELDMRRETGSQVQILAVLSVYWQGTIMNGFFLAKKRKRTGEITLG